MNMLMFVRKDAVKNGIHLIKIKLPSDCFFDGIEKIGLSPSDDGMLIHRL